MGRGAEAVAKGLAVVMFLAGALLVIGFVGNRLGVSTALLILGVVCLVLAVLLARPWPYNPVLLLDWGRGRKG